MILEKWRTSNMLNLIQVTLKGIFRDRVFHGILMVAMLLLLVPSISQFSMRQVAELSITLSLSIISFVLFLLAVFLGATSLWKDMERRYTFSVLSLPVTRTSYLLARFLGIVIFLLLTALLLGFVGISVVWIASGSFPPDRPIVWINFGAAIFFDALKYILLVAVAILFSTVSTSFFLPIFGTVSIFLVGNASQQVFNYIKSDYGQTLSPLFRECVTFLYYVLPNFSAFNLKVNAIYGLPISFSGLFLTLVYFVTYVAIVFLISSVLFARREMK